MKEGEGVNKDYQEAIRWYKLAIKNGNSEKGKKEFKKSRKQNFKI